MKRLTQISTVAICTFAASGIALAGPSMTNVEVTNLSTDSVGNPLTGFGLTVVLDPEGVMTGTPPKYRLQIASTFVNPTFGSTSKNIIDDPLFPGFVEAHWFSVPPGPGVPNGSSTTIGWLTTQLSPIDVVTPPFDRRFFGRVFTMYWTGTTGVPLGPSGSLSIATFLTRKETIPVSGPAALSLAAAADVTLTPGIVAQSAPVLLQPGNSLIIRYDVHDVSDRLVARVLVQDPPIICNLGVDAGCNTACSVANDPGCTGVAPTNGKVIPSGPRNVSYQLAGPGDASIKIHNCRSTTATTPLGQQALSSANDLLNPDRVGGDLMTPLSIILPPAGACSLTSPATECSGSPVGTACSSQPGTCEPQGVDATGLPNCVCAVSPPNNVPALGPSSAATLAVVLAACGAGLLAVIGRRRRSAS